VVTQAETIDAYMPLREDLLAATYASYVVELLDRFTYEEGENRGLYRLLTETLSRLASSRSTDPSLETGSERLLQDLSVRYTKCACWTLLVSAPAFCVPRCQEEIKPQDQFFSAERGGVLCPKCARGVTEARPVTMNVLRYLRHFQRSNWNEAARAPLSAALNREIEMVMQYY